MYYLRSKTGSLRLRAKGQAIAVNMRALLLFALTYSFALAAPNNGPTKVPWSGSADGKFALFYTPSKDAEDTLGFFLYFREDSMAPASAQLIPAMRDQRPDGKPFDRKEVNDLDTQALLSRICLRNEFHLQKELFDPAFSYSVTWTPDSQWVVIEGGAHKFWHMVAYHFAGGRFRQVDLATLSSQIESYFTTHMAKPAFQELGIKKSISAKGGENHESSYVAWLEDGRLAVLGYPFLLQNGDFNRLQEKGVIYFLVDCRDPRHAEVIAMAH